MEKFRVIISDLHIKRFVEYISIFNADYTMQKYPCRQVRFDVSCNKSLYNMLYRWVIDRRIDYFIINDFLNDNVTLNDILTNDDLYYKYVNC